MAVFIINIFTVIISHTRSQRQSSTYRPTRYACTVHPAVCQTVLRLAWYIRPIRFENSIRNRVGRPIQFERKKTIRSSLVLMNIDLYPSFTAAYQGFQHRKGMIFPSIFCRPFSDVTLQQVTLLSVGPFIQPFLRVTLASHLHIRPIKPFTTICGPFTT